MLNMIYVMINNKPKKFKWTKTQLNNSLKYMLTEKTQQNMIK
jgi:hypothetical protein